MITELCLILFQYRFFNGTDIDHVLVYFFSHTYGHSSNLVYLKYKSKNKRKKKTETRNKQTNVIFVVRV
jgi:hypothetical protein